MKMFTEWERIKSPAISPNMQNHLVDDSRNHNYINKENGLFLNQIKASELYQEKPFAFLTMYTKTNYYISDFKYRKRNKIQKKQEN